MRVVASRVFTTGTSTAWPAVQQAVRALMERDGLSEADSFARPQRTAAAQGTSLTAAAQKVSADSSRTEAHAATDT